MSTKKQKEKQARRSEVEGRSKDARLVGDTSESGETRRYLEGALAQLQTLEYRLQVARNSPRQAAAEATISMFRARAQSLAQFLACGGEAAPVRIQEQIFDPVIEYWGKIYYDGKGSEHEVQE